MKHFYCSRICGLFTLLMITGCTHPFSKEETPSIKTVDDYQTERTFLAFNAPWPKEAWWEEYHDPQLTQFIQKGLDHSPDLEAVAARVKQANAYIDTAHAALLPHIGANASASTQKLSYNYLTPSSVVPKQWNDYGQASLNMSWELDFWGKNKAALAAATSQYEASLAEEAQARLLLSSAIATSYATLAQQYALKESLDASLKNNETIVELMQKRFTQGLENKASVSDAQIKYTQALGERQRCEEQIALLKNQLASLLGEGPDAGLTIQKPSINLKTAYALPKDIALNLLGRRPDIVSARLQVEAKASKIHQKEAAFYPNINLSALIGFQSLGLNNLTKSGSDYGAVEPAIYLPIFSAGTLESDLKNAKASYEESVANYNSTLVHALQDIADVGVNQKSLTAQIKTARESVSAATQSYDVANQRYLQGLASYIDVLFVNNALLASQKNLIALESRSLILDIAIKRSLGGGYLSHDHKAKE